MNNKKMEIILIVISFVVSLIFSCLIYSCLSNLEFIENMIKLLNKAIESKEIARNLGLFSFGVGFIVFGCFSLGISIMMEDCLKKDNVAKKTIKKMR